MSVATQAYEEIPEDLREALETAFSNLTVCAADVMDDELEVVEDLVPVDMTSGKPPTDARSLHARLVSRQEFSNWFKKRKDDYDLVKDQE